MLWVLKRLATRASACSGASAHAGVRECPTPDIIITPGEDQVQRKEGGQDAPGDEPERGRSVLVDRGRSDPH